MFSATLKGVGSQHKYLAVTSWWRRPKKAEIVVVRTTIHFEMEATRRLIGPPG
jgi:hypothetical protein